MLSLSQFTAMREQRPLFAPLTLELAAGDCVELLGPNGSGKSTLLKSIVGLHTQFDGSLDSAPFVFQGHRLGLDEILTPVENLAWFAALEGEQCSDDRARELLTRMGVPFAAFTPCGKLSQGQQRRVAMARWLLSRRKLWLLDEPFTALDKDAQSILNELLREHCAGGGAVLCATHVELDVNDKKTVSLVPA